MPFVETRLISPTTLTTSAANALYTVPTGYSAIIKQLVVTNITGTPATFTFYIGATVSASNALFSGTSVAGNDTVIINLSQVLTTGETLRALSSVGSALNLTVSGVINDGPLASTATYIPDGAITAAKIADGSIMNLEINASAAIAQSKIANLTSDLALKAPLASPTFTGTPLAPTATIGTNTTQVATTAFVTASNATYSGQPLKIYSDQSLLAQKIYAATNDTFNNITTYTTNPLATSYLLFTVGVAYEYNASSDGLTIALSINGTEQFSFGDTTNATTYNEFPYYTFRSINSYAASSSISNIRTYIKSANGTVVCPRTTGGPVNFSITIQEYAA